MVIWMVICDMLPLVDFKFSIQVLNVTREPIGNKCIRTVVNYVVDVDVIARFKCHVITHIDGITTGFCFCPRSFFLSLLVILSQCDTSYKVKYYIFSCHKPTNAVHQILNVCMYAFIYIHISVLMISCQCVIFLVQWFGQVYHECFVFLIFLKI